MALWARPGCLEEGTLGTGGQKTVPKEQMRLSSQLRSSIRWSGLERRRHGRGRSFLPQGLFFFNFFLMEKWEMLGRTEENCCGPPPFERMRHFIRHIFGTHDEGQRGVPQSACLPATPEEMEGQGMEKRGLKWPLLPSPS